MRRSVLQGQDWLVSSSIAKANVAGLFIRSLRAELIVLRLGIRHSSRRGQRKEIAAVAAVLIEKLRDNCDFSCRSDQFAGSTRRSFD